MVDFPHLRMPVITLITFFSLKFIRFSKYSFLSIIKSPLSIKHSSSPSKYKIHFNVSLSICQVCKIHFTFYLNTTFFQYLFFIFPIMTSVHRWGEACCHLYTDSKTILQPQKTFQKYNKHRPPLGNLCRHFYSLFIPLSTRRPFRRHNRRSPTTP